MSTRVKHEPYREFVIRTNLTSHRGTRMYEAAVFRDSKVLDVTSGRTRPEATLRAMWLIEEHLAGRRTLRNLRPHASRTRRSR